MTKILVGCPLYKRDWALPKWLDSVALQAKDGSFDISLVFCSTIGADRTPEILTAEYRRERFSHITTVEVPDDGTEREDHDWTDEARVKTLARKRNAVLNAAAQLDPDYFLSLDSDTVIPEGGLTKLLAALLKHGFDAISPRVWIWTGAIAAMTWERGLLKTVYRKKRGIYEVDVVTPAACLMSGRLVKNAKVRYSVWKEGREYGWHPEGGIHGWTYSEMFAWSVEAKKIDCKLGLHADLTFEHRMGKPTE